MGGFGYNFDTMWEPIRVTSDVNYSFLLPLLWKLFWVLCVLTLCQICSYGCTMDTIDAMEFESLKFNG